MVRVEQEVGDDRHWRLVQLHLPVHLPPVTVTRILSQKHFHNGKLDLYLITYLSPKLCTTQPNYVIGDKEFLAILRCFKKWCIYLHALPTTFTIDTDHYNLQTFTTKPLHNWRQARWAGTLGQYNYTIAFQPGNQKRKSNTLTK